MSPPRPRWLSLSLANVLLGTAAVAAQVPEPPNAPAVVTRDRGHFLLTYDGVSIFDGVVRADGATLELRTLTDTVRGAVTQILKWTVRGRGLVHFSGTVAGSGEAFSAEAEPRQDGLRVVRHRTGFGTNRLDRAVYDRRRDWVLSIDFPADVTIAPLAANEDSVSFRLEASGSEVALRFRPRYYARHRGLTWYQPWTYRPWHASVAGWTSWYAFRDTVTEADIHRTADVLAERLLPYGFEYLQIDDGYQRLPIGTPDHWLTANAKFPTGLDALRRYIAARGLKPGLWTNVSFQDRSWAETHPDYFVHDSGGPASGNWVGFVMDGSNRATLDTLMRPVYQTLARSGWVYFKVDALRHLLYEGYNSHADYFRRRGLDRVEVYRGLVQAIRDAIGRGVFMLGCWGIRPELIGIVDAVRVGNDGFGYGGFAQYNSFNNVVWRNDPDHIELSQQDAYRATSLASLTGSLLMLTDPPEVYRTDRVEAARRAAPVMFTVPGQLYDVDPSRSERLTETATTVSGSGPRPFDAEQRLVATLYQLDVNRPFERWTVLARTAGAPAMMRFTDLGLATGIDYTVFEFWTKRLLGDFRDSFRAGPIDSGYQVQVFCIRERTRHPQLLATNRHVTCGGPDVERVSWNGTALEGESSVVTGDPYELYLSEPAGYRFAGAQVERGTLQSSARVGAVRTVRIRSTGGGTIRWRVRWEVAGGGGS
jgi:alpha-galactosidase